MLLNLGKKPMRINKILTDENITEYGKNVYSEGIQNLSKDFPIPESVEYIMYIIYTVKRHGKTLSSFKSIISKPPDQLKDPPRCWKLA